MSAAPHPAEVIRRPVRLFPPAVPVEPLVIAPPPARPEPEGSRWLTTVLPALSSLGIVGFAVVSGSLLYVVLGICLAVLAVGVAVGARISSLRSRRRRREAMRARYAEHLDERHEALSAVTARQRRAAVHLLPGPADWPRLFADARLWERRAGDPDFLTARLGRGRVALAAPVRLEPPSPSTEEETDLRQEADDLVALHAVVDDVPLALALARHRSVVIEGPMADARPLLRAIVLGLAAGHAPDDLGIAALVDTSDEQWLARLPHARDHAGLLARSRTDSGDPGIGQEVDRSGPTVLLVVDTAAPPERLIDVCAAPGTCLLWLARESVHPPPDPAAMISLLPDGSATVQFADGSGTLAVARPDAVGPTAAHEVVTALADAARCRPRPQTDKGRNALPVRLQPLLTETAQLGADAPLCPDGEPGTALTAPLGRDRFGDPVMLDLAEAAAGGVGPHGLLIGATGSGKSELLRALLLGLCLRHGPDELALLCWDFKGGAAIAPFADLPHVRGLVTNLADDPRLVDRAGRALRAEISRRQRVLRAAGVDDLAAYRACDSSARVPLPALVVVVDEFSELLAAAPDLLDLFVSVGRLGRSLGVHLLLSSQRLDEGRLRGLESHLRFRVCLRTFSSADSRTVLGTDAAHRLPAVPGSGLLAVDGRVLRFDGAYADDLGQLLDQAQARWGSVPATDASLWLPPLPRTLPFEDLPDPDPRADARTGIAVGLVDRPDEQRRDPLVVDLDQGHVAVVGAPGTGRSTLVTTLVSALDGRRGACGLPVYVVGDVAPFEALVDLPHVGAVCPVDDEDRLRAVMSLLADPATTGAPTATALLVIDGWARFRNRHEDLADLVTDWAGRGGGGIRLLVTGTSWADFRATLKAHLNIRFEFRLGDPYESEHGRAAAEQLPAGTPGRLLTPEGDEAQVALPPVELPPTAPSLPAPPSAAGPPGRPSFPPTPAPRPTTLPTRVRLSALPSAGRFPVLGASAAGPTPAALDLLGADRQLVVLGEAGSGRSTALQVLLTQLDPSAADIWVIDLRRALLPFLPAAARYAYSTTGAGALLGELTSRLRARLPAEGLTPADLRAATGGPGRPQVLVVDDADLLTGSPLTGSLGGLTELLPLSAEVGLSVVIARRGGARAGFDPSWQALVDAGANGLLLSGSALDGPVLRGVRLRPRPPGRGDLVRPGQPPLPVQVATPEPPGPWRWAGAGRPRVGEVSAVG